MDVKFNTVEVFEIAEKIERNGVRFYRKAAELFDEPGIRKTFLELADWERTHEKVFADMRKQISEQNREPKSFEPENDIVISAQAMAGLAVFGINPDPSEELTGKESKKEIFEKALRKEEDSIVYYVGLKDFVSERAGKDKIDDIIREELRHIGILSQALERR
ncbi:MAG: ferritin family protein [Planctomycetota bacterium]|jgi:rubrerythrin